MSAGRSGSSQATSGTSTAQAAATVHTTGRQPWCVASAASIGRKISVPVAVLAVSRPIIRPRLRTNQRFTTVAPSTIATQPEPTPENTPQLSSSCQDSVIHPLTAIDAAINASAPINVRRMPIACISAAANGPIMP